MCGDGTLDNTGVLSIVDLTIASESSGDLLMFKNGSWDELGTSTAGKVLKIDGDGYPAWLDETAGSDNKISWFENDGSGNFTEHIIIQNWMGSGFVMVRDHLNNIDVDIDGDGDTDILASAIPPGNRICWFENELDSLVDCAVVMIENRIKKNELNGMNYFYQAMAYGSRSARLARHRKWFEAFKDSRRLKKSLEKSLHLNPYFYDTYYGLGLYNYWSSVKAKFLGFFVGDKKKGVEQLKLAIEKSQFMQTNAMFGLMVIHIHKQQLSRFLTS